MNKNYDRREVENEAKDFIREHWTSQAEEVISCALEERAEMSLNEFLTHCTACGGDWGQMFLTGMRELFPKTYDAIPEDMGIFAFAAINQTLLLCGVFGE